MKISRAKAWVRLNQKYAPVLFFICGFIWDTLTLGRIDRLYDRVILSTYLTSLTACLYLYNLKDDDKFKGTFFERYEVYLPLAIQFFLGGLCSAYVIYFSRSVTFTKTLSFFVILVFLLFANELLKKRISNKYLQFSAYFFMNFTFFTFFLPVLLKQMSTFIFLISGVISLVITIMLITFIYNSSPSTRLEISKRKMVAIIAGIYLMINTFYFTNLIPPVPLALDSAVVAYNVEKGNGDYVVTYDRETRYKFWRENSFEFSYTPGERVYVFSSIFAPTDLRKEVAHRWKWRNPATNKWEITDTIRYEITGGRDEGYRGFTFKQNMQEGRWRVDVITVEGQIIGMVDFEIEFDSDREPNRLVTRIF
ncbi:MAG: DUF2914 domain-containing protein [Balneolaceae bacterium]|nr:MAG: DUF2914 domain-containing protein [Balneolaceae bacterium]